MRKAFAKERRELLGNMKKNPMDVRRRVSRGDQGDKKKKAESLEAGRRPLGYYIIKEKKT